MTDEELAIGKRHVANWKVAGELLDRLKWEELRALTEAQSAEQFAQLSTDMDAGRSPERRDGAGLIEQQRWFRKFHESRRSS